MNTRALQGRRPLLRHRSAGALYPLQESFLTYGLLVGLGATVLFMSPLAGFAFLVLFATIGVLWRRGEPPVLAFCVAYQWVFIVTGYLFQQLLGYYPSLSEQPGDLSGAVLFSLLGLSFLVAGIRLGLHARPARRVGKAARAALPSVDYDLKRLFWAVIATHTAQWVVSFSAMGIWYTGAQLLSNLLQFRTVLLFMLFLAVLRQRAGYRYAGIALLYALLPSLASEMSAFKMPFILLFVALLAEWKPWSRLPDVRVRSKRILAAASVVGATLVVLGLVWLGGVKRTWRFALRSGQVTGSPIEKIEAFSSTVASEMSHFEVTQAVENGASRFSSSTGYFSYVLERVPEVLPHEGGDMTWRAVRHIAMPRVLFPGKPSLGSDSWLVQTYAGVPVAGAEQGTSVGLTYMAQFYIDFGMPGMFVPLIIYGLAIGLLYRMLRWFSPSRTLYLSATTVLLLAQFTNYGTSFAKLLGGLLMNFFVFCAILYFAGPWLHRTLIKRTPQKTSRLTD